MKKKGVDKDFMKLMNNELSKNREIFNIGRQLDTNVDV